MWESFFGFKKTPFSDSPDTKQLFASEAWNQVKTRLEFLANHHGVGLLTGFDNSKVTVFAKPVDDALTKLVAQRSLSEWLDQDAPDLR